MKPEISEKGILNLGRHVLLEEAKELEAIAGRLDETFVKAVTPVSYTHLTLPTILRV